MHIHEVMDERGDLVDRAYFCCDSCHRSWCREHDEPYGGWDGCHEAGNGPEYCSHCGVLAGGVLACGCMSPVVVNLIDHAATEKCDHGCFLKVARH